MGELANEVFVARHRGRIILHAPLLQISCVINEPMAAAVRALQNDGSAPAEALGELHRCGLLGSPEVAPPRSVTVEHPTELTLLLTRRCNLRCTYCYARGGEGVQTLSFGAAADALAHLVANALRTGCAEVTVHLHGGGEITVEWALLQAVIAEARRQTDRHRLGLRLTAGLNGVLPARRAGVLADALDEATVSVDGPPAVHDRHRPTRDGGASSGVVARTLSIFDRRGLRHGIRATVTPETVEALPDSVAFLCQLSASRVIQVEPVFPRGRHASRPAVDPARFVERFRVAASVARSWGRELRYSGARFPLVSDVFCRAVTGSWCLGPDGTLTSCYEAADDLAGRFTIGRHDREQRRLVVDEARRERLLELAVPGLEECARCVAKYHCAGDCPMKRPLPGSPEGEAARAARCAINRELTLDQILEEIETRGETVPEALP